MSSEIFSRRIGARVFQSGIWIGNSPGHFKMSWPLAKLTVYRDRLEIGMLIKTFTIDLNKIEEIRDSLLFGIVIKHHDGRTLDTVQLRGWGLMKQLMELDRKYGLELPLGSGVRHVA